MTVKNTLRLRFTFNRQTGTSEPKLAKSFRGFAAVTIAQAGVAVAQGKYDSLRRQIKGDLEPLIRKELEHLANQYKRFIIGKQRIGGQITSYTKEAARGPSRYTQAQERVQLKSVLPDWAPLSPKYLARKPVKPNWFKFRGSDGHNTAGSMEQGISAGSWEQMFGPISVTVQAKGAGDGSTKIAYTNLNKGTLRIGVAAIRARVFGQLTPAMVAGLAGGSPKETGDGRTNGLLAMVAAVNPRLALKLGFNSSDGHHYRPSLEPFLAFAVTRSVPAALAKRFEVAGYLTK